MARAGRRPRVSAMSGGHLGGSVTNCPECWEMAYEPGWYAVLSAGEPAIHLPDEMDGQVVVRIADRGTNHPSNRARHNPVTSRRSIGRQAPPGPGLPA